MWVGCLWRAWLKLNMEDCLYQSSSFTWRGSGVTVLAETVSNTDSSAFILPFWAGAFFWVGGRHFNETVMPLSFSHYVAVVPPPDPRPVPSCLLACVQTVLTLYYLNPLNFLAQRKQSFCEKKERKEKENALPLCTNLLWGVWGLLCCCGSWNPEMYSNLLLPPINFAGFLAAVPGQVRTMQL